MKVKQFFSFCTSLFLFVFFSNIGIAAETPTLDGLHTESLNLTQFDSYKRELAASFAEKLQDKRFMKAVKKSISENSPSVSLHKLVKSKELKSKYQDFGNQLALFDKKIRQAKGIENYTDELLEVSLALPDQAMSAFQKEDDVLIAYVPSNDESQWNYIEAYDRFGNVHFLDPYQQPSQPVLVVGINSREDMRAGLQMVNEALQKAGVQSTNTGLAADHTMTVTGDIETTKLNSIRLNDDQEPWISGKAEVYAIVNGVQPDQMEAEVTIVDMPYLDKEDTTYYPNQIVIFWSQYRYAAANINLYEKDDNYNWQELIDVILQATASVMATFPQTAPYAGLATLANTIIQAMPSQWFTNNDDYVDVFYTIEKGRYYSSYYGASANAKVSMAPYILQQN